MPRYQRLPVTLRLFRFPHFGLLFGLLPITALTLLSATDVPSGLKASGETTPRYQRLPVDLRLFFRFRRPFDLLPVTALALLSAMDVPFVLKAPGKTMQR
jgi:hypothetical protein